MSWASTMPAAVTALVAMCRGSADLAGVEVRDGPELTNADANLVLTIGYIGPDDDEAASGQESTGDLGASADREQYVIRCAAAVKTGDPDVPGSRAQAGLLFAAVGKLIAADTHLRGTVMNAQITTWALRQDSAQGGTYARLRFDVAIDAFTAR